MDMALDLHSSTPAPTVFEQLAAKDHELTTTVLHLREACSELAAKNGQGEPIRQRIRQAFFLLRGTSRGASR